MITKPLKQIIFRPVQEVWQDVAGDSGTLADFLTEYEIVIDDRTEFAKIKDYEKKYLHMVKNGCDESHRYNMGNVPKLTINRYTIFRDGKVIENNLIGWRTAIAHARKWSIDLFYNVRKIEIMNVYTAEIISLEEAEQRTKKFISAQKLKGRSH